MKIDSDIADGVWFHIHERVRKEYWSLINPEVKLKIYDNLSHHNMDVDVTNLLLGNIDETKIQVDSVDY